MNDNLIVGLDIGTTKIVCFVGRKNENGKIEIIGMGKADSRGVSRGVVVNVGQAVESIQLAVQEASKMANVEISSVNVGIAGQHIKSIQHRGYVTRKSYDDEISHTDVDALIKDMTKLVMPPGEGIIHVLPQEYIVDGEEGIKDPIGMSGVRLEANFHIITGQVAAINNIYRCVQRAGLTVDELILEPLASSDSVLSNDDKEAGVALVDIGGGTTDIAIFYDGIIRHTAVIPFGGSIITSDIQEGCAILKQPAEKLKVKFGSAIEMPNQENEIVVIPGLHGLPKKEISIQNLTNIIQARMEEIIGMVHYEIRNSGYEKKLLAGVVLTGGGSMLRHLKHLFEYSTGLHARIGVPEEHLAKVCSEEILGPTYATGVGLVVRGFTKKTEVVPEVITPIVQHSEGEIKTGFFEKIKNNMSRLFEDEIN